MCGGGKHVCWLAHILVLATLVLIVSFSYMTLEFGKSQI